MYRELNGCTGSCAAGIWGSCSCELSPLQWSNEGWHPEKAKKYRQRRKKERENEDDVIVL
jgi:hypothetical protein